MPQEHDTSDIVVGSAAPRGLKAFIGGHCNLQRPGLMIMCVLARRSAGRGLGLRQRQRQLLLAAEEQLEHHLGGERLRACQDDW